MTLIQFFNIYIIIGLIVGIPLARYSWREWRNTPSKYNLELPTKFANRTVDAFVYIVSWFIIVFLYPLYILEIIIKRGNKK